MRSGSLHICSVSKPSCPPEIWTLFIYSTVTYLLYLPLCCRTLADLFCQLLGFPSLFTFHPLNQVIILKICQSLFAVGIQCLINRRKPSKVPRTANLGYEAHESMIMAGLMGQAVPFPVAGEATRPPYQRLSAFVISLWESSRVTSAVFWAHILERAARLCLWVAMF